MDRSQGRKHVPICPHVPALPDQYSRDVKDTNYYSCINGLSKPIYDCTGDVHFSLPLEEWPRANQIHPEVALQMQQVGKQPQGQRYLKLW